MKQSTQLDLLKRIAETLEQTNELLILLLTPVAAKHYKARIGHKKARKLAAKTAEPSPTDS